MPRIDLNSTSLTAATYLDGQTVLELEFRSGAVYRYVGVPAETYGELVQAQSKGTYFNHYIRNRFCYAKIRPEEPTRDDDSDAIGLVQE
jgi:KTSC domain